MKKYKLIKQFPDGPELGQVAEYQEGNNNYYIKGEGFGTLHYRYSKRTVEEMPEFWEEVKEKEWEVLVFKCTFDEKESFTRLKENGFYVSDDASEEFKRTNKGATLKYMLNDYDDDTSSAKIYSIKRLSDGEVFTVGDTIQNKYSISAEIVEIKLNAGLIILMIPTSNKFRFEAIDLCDAKKTEKKTVYGVNAPFTKTVESKFAIEKLEAAFPAGNWKWFNSEKERDFYIEENKPRFSMKDLMSFGKYVGGRTEITSPLQTFYDWNKNIRKEK